MWAIKNSHGEFLVLKSRHDGRRFHHQQKFARTYRTGKGAKCAATRWRNMHGVNVQVVQVEA